VLTGRVCKYVCVYDENGLGGDGTALWRALLTKVARWRDGMGWWGWVGREGKLESVGMTFAEIWVQGDGRFC